jgi:flagellar biosynthesis protein FliR
MDLDFLQLPFKIFENLNVIWTFVLLLVRFTALLALIPGLSMGFTGLMVRLPAIMVLAFSAMFSSPMAQLPPDWVQLLVQMGSEFALGLILAMIPMMIVSGVQMAGHMASTTMGLQASQLIDPTLQMSIPDIARIYGDLVTVMFLLSGGQHIIIHVAAGLGGKLIPGGFMMGAHTAGLLISLSSVNIFIVSFPLTIGIGLILSLLVLPELVTVASRALSGIEPSVLSLVQDVNQVP